MNSDTELTRNKIGLFSLIFFVVAAASPLTGLVGGMPIAIVAGNGSGVPGIYAISGGILLLFSIGYITMSRYITNSGAFYAYITEGLGRKMGVAALGLAILSYVAIQLAIAALFGSFTRIFLFDYFNIDIPWWACTIVMLIVVCFLAIEKIELGGRVMGLLMILEVGIALLIVAYITFGTVQQGNLDFSTFSPSVIMQGDVGIALVICVGAFIGFEATSLYSDECRNPERTVPLATILAVLIITIFFAFCSWSMIQVYGVANTQAIAAENPAVFVLNIAENYFGKWIVVVIHILLITSLFAATQSFHNNIARYFYVMARDGIFWRRLNKLHPSKQSPYVSSSCETITMIGIFVILTCLRQDPLTDIFTWGSSIATLSILVLQIFVSLAVIVYFRRHADLRQPQWKVIWSPILAILFMLGVVIIILANLHAVSGSTSNWIYLVPVLVFGSAIGGYIYALILKKFNPKLFLNLDHFIHEDIAHET